jgi:acyl-CoA synthetase (AMP-forming)/AMP-acid ligase II
MRERGLGCYRERSELANWESGQDHVALYLYNGNEYLEGMLGSYKARCAPFNVNYRYVERELAYLLDNAKARAVIYAASFAPLLAKIRSELPELEFLLQVADDSAHPLLDGAVDYEAALASSSSAPAPDDLTEDDLYILYTGGTTGMPKGVLWRQEDIFRSALGGDKKSLDEVLERVRSGSPVRSLPAPPFMHGAAHWVAFSMWYIGGTILVQSNVNQLDPHDVWSTVERERANQLLIVGDAFARPLIDQLSLRDYDLSSLRRVGSGGAIFTASLKRQLLEQLPDVRILDALGSSESGSQAAHLSSRTSGVQTGEFEMVAGNCLLKRDLSGTVESGSEELGWLARSGRVPLGYYADPEKTASTFPIVNGTRYSVPGDLARLGPDGTLHLLGRDSATINSGGEKIFAEEVELALKQHPDVYDAVVVGTPSERWGQQVTAVVQRRDGSAVDSDAIREVAGTQITRYKLPKKFVFVDQIQRAPSGKADYRWAKETALAALDGGPSQSD